MSNKTGVVFLVLYQNTQIKIENVTSMQVCNVGTNDVLINGLKFTNSTKDCFYTSLVEVDGSESTIELDIEFMTDGNDSKLQIIYKKTIVC